MISLALLVQTDTTEQQQQAARALAGLGIGFFVAIGLIALAFFIFNVYLYWRMFTKAGMPGAIGLVALIPNLGGFICNCILAFASWKVIPAPVQYVAGLPPNYPPQAPLPPTNYPSQY